MLNKIVVFLALIFYTSCKNISHSVNNNSEVFISNKYIQMGKIAAKTQKDTVFYIKNIGEYPLVIDNVETSCGCTTPKWTLQPIEVGDSGTVFISYDAKYPGKFRKTIAVFANVAEIPIELSICGEVEFEDDINDGMQM